MVRRKSDRPSKTPPTKKANRSQGEKSAVFVGRKLCQVSKCLIMEITKLQSTTRTLIPKLCFARLVREIIQGFGKMDYKIEGLALSALQEAAELYLVHMFEDSYMCAAHARRVTLMPPDMKLVRFIRNRFEPYM